MDARRNAVVLALLGKQNAENDRYYLALGQFIAQYATVEGMLRSALWVLAGVKPPVAQAVLSGVRTEDAISYIYRIGQAKKWGAAKTERFKFIFDQIQSINKLRNDIVHRGASLQSDGSWLSTNKAIVHIPERTINTTITPTILDSARNDLYEIRLCVAFLAWGHRFSPGMKKMITEILNRTWRYKPAPQGRKSKTSQKARQRQKRQLQSSQQ